MNLLGGLTTAAMAQMPPTSRSESPKIAQSSTAPTATYPTLQLGSTGDRVSELQSMLTLLSFYDGDVDGVYSESTQAAVSQFQAAAGLESNGVVGPETWEKLLPAPNSVADTPDMPPEQAIEATANADEVTNLETSNDSSELPNLDEEASSSAPIPSELPPSESPADSDSTMTSQVPEAPSVPEETVEPTDEAAPEPSSEPAPEAVEPTDEAEPAEPTEVSLPILRKGMQGSAVSSLQSRLQTLGFYGGEIDGAFGEQTEIAVQNLQREYELGVDGVVGPATWSVLLR